MWAIATDGTAAFHLRRCYSYPWPLTPGLQQRPKADDDQEERPPVAEAKAKKKDESYGANEQATDEVASPSFS